MQNITNIMDYKYKVITLYHMVKNNVSNDLKTRLLDLLKSNILEDIILAEEIIKINLEL